MPRKPKRQSRDSRVTRKTLALDSRYAGNPARRIFHQCQACGALVERMFGLGDESFCPHCKKYGEVYCGEGVLPDPALYCEWLEKQQAKPTAIAGEKNDQPNFHSQNGVSEMKQKKLHTGTYCCPECCIEFDLTAEESLKCDRCGGVLLKGSLDDFENEGDEDTEP